MWRLLSSLWGRLLGKSSGGPSASALSGTLSRPPDDLAWDTAPPLDDLPPLPPLAPLPPGADVPSGYRLLERIGSSASGAEVFRAAGPDGRLAALRRFLAPSEDELRRWWEQTRPLRHRFLLELLGCWAEGRRAVVVAALADDGLAPWLRRLLSRGAACPAVPLLRCLRGAAQALDFLHARGVFPNEVNPSNLLLVCGRVRLDLFGTPRARDDRAVAGVPRYMAPELWRGQPHAHSDQYALAVVYFQMRTGRFPFGGDAIPDIVVQALEGTADLTGLPEAEQGPLRRALARGPGERFPSCTALLRELWRAGAAEGAPPHDAGAPLLTAAADPSWLRWKDGLLVRLARAIDEGGRFEELPVLADALEEAGCTDAAVLAHCRDPGPHARGCFVVDLLTGREGGGGRPTQPAVRTVDFRGQRRLRPSYPPLPSRGSVPAFYARTRRMSRS